ncbi:APC family permease [Steroidobacter sp.]|uniref:APC family permease n=1 Tax=Steroidobacter sp. TaxID=1978227 RepID=UPI001A3B2880|nr:amino acid permease [Steroidobacter sp.]MBL8271379.1 APC family permease [Steroidobacter sp.]
MSQPTAISPPLVAGASVPRQGLTRMHLFMMCFGAIVGVGWITVLGQWLSLAGPGGSVVALLLGAVSVTIVASNYALLARRDLFAAGGEIGAVKESLGAGAAFAVTAALSLATLGVVAFEAVSAGWILVTIFPALEGQPLYQVFGQQVHLGSVIIALAGTMLVAVLNVRPITSTASVQNGIVAIKLGVTLLFCVAGVVAGQASNLAPLLPSPADGSSPWPGVFALTATMPLWYAGFHVVAILSNERADSVRPADVAGAMRGSIVAAFIFYACIVLAASYVVPWQTLLTAPLPAAAAFRNGLSSTTFANLVLMSGLLGICSAWIACFAASVRVLRQLLLQLTGREWNARWVTVAIAVIGGTLALAGRPALVPIVNVAAMCFGLVYLLVSIATWRHAVTLRERAIVILGAVIAGAMAAYVIVSSVAAAGWLAPEVLVALPSLLAITAAWVFRKGVKSRAN